GGTASEGASDVAIDSAGNVITTGQMSGAGDYDPGAGTFTLTGAGVFISKLNSSGNFVFAKNFANNATRFATGVAVDSSNNILLTGLLGSGTVDVDPGPGVVNKTGVGFVEKLNSSGTFVWCGAFNNGNGLYWSNDIAVDGSGNAYVTGAFTGNQDFDPGSGTFNLTTQGTSA